MTDETTWKDFVEKELISKRFILAIIIVMAYLVRPEQLGEAIVGAIVGYYFGTHQTEPSQS